MNWLKFQEEGARLTEKDISKMSAMIIQTYREAIKEINALVSEAYLRVLSSVGTENYYNEMLKRNRLEILQAEVKAAYTNYSQKAGVYTKHALSIAMSNQYYRGLYAASWVQDGVFGVLPYDLVELVVFGTSDAWKKIPKSIIEKYGSLANYQSKAGTLTELLLSNRRKEIDAIQRTIASGLKLGQSYTQMAQSIKGTIGAVTKMPNGKTVASGSMANAMRVVQTEGVRAMNAGNYAAMQQIAEDGGDVKKQWSAALDNRTRAGHARLDGKRIGVDEEFAIGDDHAKYPGGFGKVKNNANCRCSVNTIINDVSPQARTGRNPRTGKNEYFEWKSFEDWAKEQGLKTNIYGEKYA